VADFCFQCNVDHMFGAYSDFDHLRKHSSGLGDRFVVLCEGCGVIRVDRDGCCRDPGCRLHDDIAPCRSEVYGSAWRWAAARSGRLGPLRRLRDRLLGTPWEPGRVHYWRHWWSLFWPSLKSGVPIYVAEIVWPVPPTGYVYEDFEDPYVE